MSFSLGLAYPLRVKSNFPCLSRLLRASVLALLVLGLMIKPVLSQISELHAAEHAVAADVHGHDHGADSTDDGGDPEQDDHTSGAHCLMHQVGGSTTLTGLAASMFVPMIYARMPDLPIPDAISVPHDVPSSPFRPPIG